MDHTMKKSLRTASNANSLLLLVFYMIMALATIGISYGLSLFLPVENAYCNAVYQILVYFVQYVITVPLLMLLFRAVLGKRIGWKLRDSYHKPQATAGQVFRWCLMALGLTYAASVCSSLFWNVIQMLTQTEFQAPSMVAEDNWIGYLSNILAMAIYAPIFEEMLFRATLFRNTERFGSWFGIITIGITFGLWHCNYEQLLYTAVLGICAAFLTARTRSVLPAMAVHFTMNLIGTVQSIAYGSLGLESFKSLTDLSLLLDHVGQLIVIGFSNLLAWGLLISGCILFILELIKHPETFRFENATPQVSGGKKALVYWTAPVTIICVIVLLIMTICNIMGM